MKIEDVKQQMNPFKPFTIYTSDGFQIDILHTDYILFSPKGNNIVAVDLNGGIHVISVDHIVRTEYK